MDSQSMIVNRRLANAVLAGGLFVIASIFVSTVWVLYAHKQVLDMRAEYASLKHAVNGNKDVSTALNPNQQNESATSALPVEGKAEKESVTTPIVTADTVIAEKKTEVKQTAPEKKEVKTNEPRLVQSKDVALNYYFRKADNESLQIVLNSLGYVFDVRTLDENTGYQKTNCIWFGAGVPLKDVKKVAIALIQSGNTINGIKRFPLSKKNPSYKKNIIEVGRDMKYENYYSKPLSIVEVERAKDFR